MLSLIVLVVALLSASQSFAKRALDPLDVEAEIVDKEGDPPEPYLGGLHSTDAHFVSVSFSLDPKVYAPRTLSETLRNL